MMSGQSLVLSTYSDIDTVVTSDQNEVVGQSRLRTSARVNKKVKFDIGDTTQSNQNHTNIAHVSISQISSSSVDNKLKKDEVKQQTKSKPVWSFEERSLFFEAINEHGKDIEAVHNYFVQKAKKRGKTDNQIKTREQMRCYYYRTWMKISKFLTFSEELKKVAQELYALINYGELRKKLSVKNKTYVKLSELIYRGSVKIHLKKKIIRVRTPMCPALRKLNALDDDKHEEFKLPPSISLELRPKNNQTWLTLQSLSQNPRIKTSVPLQYRLHNLLSYLSQKWNVNSKNSAVSDMFDINEKILHLGPKSGVVIDKPMINISNNMSASQISLNAYEERIGIKNRSETLWLASQTANSTRKLAGAKRVRSDSSSDINRQNKRDEEEPIPVQEAVDIAVNKILELKTDFSPKWDQQEDGHSTSWTLDNSGSLSIGQLYLMFGADSKLELQYWWESKETTTLIKDNIIENNKVVNEISQSSSNSLILKRLLSLAKVYYSKSKPNHAACLSVNQLIKEKQSYNESDQSTIFTKPLNPASQFYSSEAIQAQLNSLRNITPRFSRRGRVAKKQIVQRVLPLLPKFPEKSHSLVQMKIPQSGEFIPVITSTNLSSKRLTSKKTSSKSVLTDDTAFTVSNNVTSTLAQQGRHSDIIEAANQTPDLVPLTAADICDELEFFSNTFSDSAPPSPSKLLNDNDSRWLDSEIADCSFSSFLGQLESPIRVTNGNVLLSNEDTRFSITDIDNNYDGFNVNNMENNDDFIPKFSILSSEFSKE